MEVVVDMVGLTYILYLCLEKTFVIPFSIVEVVDFDPVVFPFTLKGFPRKNHCAFWWIGIWKTPTCSWRSMHIPNGWKSLTSLWHLDLISIHDLGILSPIYRRFWGVVLSRNSSSKKLMSRDPFRSFLREDKIWFANHWLQWILILYTSHIESTSK